MPVKRLPRSRGPEQIVSGRSDGKSAGAPVSEVGRTLLADLMQEGLGDHVLLLRIYQVPSSA